LQVKAQVPDSHLALPFAGTSQLAPHAPQCVGSVAVSTHALPHCE
jgi:hypothetical protein